MARFSLSRRTGALLAGVVPPTGVPLPQQTLGIGTWIGTKEELADPGTRAELLRLARMRRELRAGHLTRAARTALEVDLRALPDDPRTTRTVAVLRSVGATLTDAADPGPEELLRASLGLLGPRIPPALLDRLLEQGSRVDPTVVERVCLAHDASPGAVARLRVLLVRRAAQDWLASGDRAGRALLDRRVQQARATAMHENLLRWVELVGARARDGDSARMARVIDALGHNLPLTDPRNKELHEALTRCFDWPGLDKDVRQQLTRLSFSAWSTLRDVEEGTGAAELVSFSAQAAAFRQVFEILLVRSLLDRFVRAGGAVEKGGPLDAVQRGESTLGIGKWHGLLRTTPRRLKPPWVATIRAWFDRDEAVSSLREGQALRGALGELMRVRLHGLPHDEESARIGASDVLRTVARVGFGVVTADGLPQRGEGLVGLLCGVLP